ncbi:uncharacterized protein L199_002937 [Kwoniella botswanensis]|uniref:uncharacterized protein n=1 Tax=Kwoniella botswanensis TaxID=1268659 RepID=UPI00315D01E9
MASTAYRDKSQTSAWIPPESPTTTTAANADFSTVKKYFRREITHDEDSIRQDLGIPSVSTYPKHRQFLSGFKIVFIVSDNLEGAFYFVDGCKIKEDTKRKKNEFISVDAVDEKELFEEIVLWNFASRYIRNFVTELGGHFQVISQYVKFEENPSNLIFVTAPHANPTIPNRYLNRRSTLYSSPYRFIEYFGTRESDGKDGKSQKSTSSESEFDENGSSGVQEDKLASKVVEDIGRWEIKTKSNDLDGDEQDTKIDGPARKLAVDDACNEAGQVVHAVNDRKRIVSAETEKDTDKEHSPKKGKTHQ